MDWGIACIKKDRESPVGDTELPEDKRRKRFTLREELRGNIIGTPCYMPPEQAHGDLKSIDERSDVFSIGAILYEILTGTYPIPGKSLQEMVINARKCEIQPPNEKVDFPLPIGLVRITMKAMSKEPADRYQSIKKLKEALENFLEDSERFPGRSYRCCHKKSLL
jgi:serine/threonine-protein kinase